MTEALENAADRVVSLEVINKLQIKVHIQKK